MPETIYGSGRLRPFQLPDVPAMADRFHTTTVDSITTRAGHQQPRHFRGAQWQARADRALSGLQAGQQGVWVNRVVDRSRII